MSEKYNPETGVGEKRTCPECERAVIVAQRVVERCGDMDVLCPDCGCAFEPKLGE